jgi:ankyrin repeat protein
VQPASIKWLLDHGANPNCAKPNRKYPGTALDQVITSYGRSLELGACIDILVDAGGLTKYNLPPVLDLLRNRIDLLAEHLAADRTLLQRRFAELDFGVTGARQLTLQGATLLHVAAEYGNLEAAKLLLDHGADVNAPATISEQGIGGQSPIFHAVTQYGDWGLPVTQLLVERGAGLAVRVKLPGHYERQGEVVECTPFGYAKLFPGTENKTVSFLPQRAAPE